MWFIETPWPPMIIAVILSLLFFSKWNKKRKKITLLVSLILLAVVPVIYLVEQKIVTEKEILESTIIDLCYSFKNKEMEKTLAFVHEDNKFDRARVKLGIEGLTVSDDLRVTDIRVRVSDDAQAASTHFRANASILFRNRALGYQPSRWRLQWAKVNDQWKIIDIDQLHIVNGEKIKTPI